MHVSLTGIGASCGKQFYYSKDADKCTDCGDSGIHTVTERVRASIVLSILFFLLIISFGGLLISRFAPGLIRESALNKLYAISDWLYKLRKKAKMRVKILMRYNYFSKRPYENKVRRLPSNDPLPPYTPLLHQLCSNVRIFTLF